VDKVQPAPFQRDLSDTHVKALEKVIDRLDRFVDPIVIVRTPEGDYWTPNGHHRLAALRKLGARSITGLLIPDFQIAYQILALNTEKSPDLKARSLEVIRLARALAAVAPAQESDYAIQFDEEAALLTLGGCYEEKARFSGSVWRPILKRCDDFLEQPLLEALDVRAERAKAMLEVDALLTAHVKALKARGADGPHVKTWVVGQLNPIRGSRGKADWDDTLTKLRSKAEAFDPETVDLRRLGVGG
jgi:ParB family chromosome partitioning protein